VLGGFPQPLNSMLTQDEVMAVEPWPAPRPRALLYLSGEGKGTLRVRTLSTEGHPGEGARHAVELHVSDSGPGIPEGIQESLFVPFVTTKERGTGLGLAISQRLVHAAGGSISAKSSPEAGATFVVRLPAVDEV
jgi:two-component system, NtrC family, sensor histidine kinase HydH